MRLNVDFNYYVIQRIMEFLLQDIVLQSNEKRSGKIILKKMTDVSCALL